MRRTTTEVAVIAVCAAMLAWDVSVAQAGGYYYRARSLYVTPPIYGYLPVFEQAPIVVYEPVVTYPPPVAGFYAPLAPAAAPAPVAAPAARVRERQVSTPFHTRYRYNVDFPGGPEYSYRYNRLGGRVRFTERWHD